MPSGGDYKFSQEFLGLIGENADFYRSILEKHSETKLGFMATDADSHLETELGEDGNLQVKVVVALDNDYDSQNGRLFLEDQFILDPQTEKFKKFERSFSLKGAIGDEHPFLAYKEKFEQAEEPSVQRAKSFAEAVCWRNFARLHPSQRRSSSYLFDFFDGRDQVDRGRYWKTRWSIFDFLQGGSGSQSHD